MSDDQFNYDQLMLDAHRGIVREVLRQVTQQGLMGEHHFYIVFDTTHPDVRLSERLLAQYPEEMTIILQYQYKNLRVLEDHFEVQLSFDNIPELLKIPYKALNGFVDPSVPFGLRLQSEPDTGLENSISMLVPGLPQKGQEQFHEDEENFEDELLSMSEARDRSDSRTPHLFIAETGDLEESDESHLSALDEDETEEAIAQVDEEEEHSATVVSLDAFRKKS